MKNYTIFLNEKEVDYNNYNKYAYLNWRFDDGMGYNHGAVAQQSVSDNFEMGKAYFANAVLTMNSLLYSDNYCSISDLLIFPVFFDIWHSIELLLKSGIQALNVKDHNYIPWGHDIFSLKIEFEAALKNKKMDLALENDLVTLNILISEFEKVGANFDFARYSFSTKGDFQFYNAPINDNRQWQNDAKTKDESRVPNTCVDLRSLFELLQSISLSFLQLVNYLALCINESEMPSDKAFDVFKKTGLPSGKDSISTKDPIMEIIIKICFDIL